MKKILVIEDETSVRENLVELLKSEDYLPIEARDGEEGVRAAWDTLPDLILCDINMPRLDGFGVLSRLRRDPTTATIPFIFLSARVEREDMRRGMSLGADDYIMKPFTIDDVLSAVQLRLEKRALIEDQVESKQADLIKTVRLSMPGEMLTPLSVVISFSEILTNRQELDRLSLGQICLMGHEINRAAGTLLRSIQNYMLFSELEAIQQDAERLRVLRGSRIFSAWMTITEMATLKARQDGRGEDLTLQVADAPLRISELYLQKIVEELLDNAFHFSPAGSLVEVTGEVHLDHMQYVLRVSDHGRGMLPEKVASLAGRLRSGGRSNEYSGQGMGLSIVKRLADLHQGSFNLQSQPGEWTIVEVSLPLSD